MITILIAAAFLGLSIHGTRRGSAPFRMILKAGTCYDENDRMEIQLTEQEQAQLREVAQRSGRNTEDVVREAINSFLQHEREFVQAVVKGLASLDRGEYVTHEEVTSRNSWKSYV